MKIDKQVEYIFEEIIDLLYKKAKSTQTVVNYLKKTYDLELSRSYELIREAKLYFGKFIMETNVNLLDECIEILKENRECAKLQNNLKEVRECTKEIGKLQQLYIENVNINLKQEQPLFTPIKKEGE